MDEIKKWEYRIDVDSISKIRIIQPSARILIKKDNIRHGIKLPQKGDINLLIRLLDELIKKAGQ